MFLVGRLSVLWLPRAPILPDSTVDIDAAVEEEEEAEGSSIQKLAGKCTKAEKETESANKNLSFSVAYFDLNGVKNTKIRSKFKIDLVDFDLKACFALIEAISCW